MKGFNSCKVYSPTTRELEINNRKNFGKFTNIQKLCNVLLDNPSESKKKP